MDVSGEVVVLGGMSREDLTEKVAFWIKSWRMWRADGHGNLSRAAMSAQILFLIHLILTQCHILQNISKSLSLSSGQVLSFMRSRCFLLYLVGLRTENLFCWYLLKASQTEWSNNPDLLEFIFELMAFIFFHGAYILATLPQPLLSLFLKMSPSLSLLPPCQIYCGIIDK